MASSGFYNYADSFRTLWEASKSLSSKHYAISHYMKGLSAECALRLIIARHDIEISDYHQYQKLYYVAARAEPRNTALQALSVDVNVITQLWDNLDRYRTDKDLFRRVSTNKVSKSLRLKGDDFKNKHLVLSKVRDRMDAIVSSFGKAAGLT